MDFKFIDVDSRKEIPPNPPGFRYLDFIGGPRELRCYLVPDTFTRDEFMQAYRTLLDPVLLPIYEHRGLTVQQDASYALPGFYVVSFTTQYLSLDAMDDVATVRTVFIMRELRAAMRKVLNVPYSHIYYEEKARASFNVHFWVMPTPDDGSGSPTRLMRINLRNYLTQYRLSEYREIIASYNLRMSSHFHDTDLASRDDLFVASFS